MHEFMVVSDTKNSTTYVFIYRNLTDSFIYLSRNPIQSKYLKYYELITTETLDVLETEEIVTTERESVSDDIVLDLITTEEIIDPKGGSVSDDIVKDIEHIEGTMI